MQIPLLLGYPHSLFDKWKNIQGFFKRISIERATIYITVILMTTMTILVIMLVTVATLLIAGSTQLKAIPGRAYPIELPATQMADLVKTALHSFP